jgi:NADPH:quinone reductase-like Zn-dependent oxidoreductase
LHCVVFAEVLGFLTELSEAGRLEPVIDRRYRLQHVAEAHRYAETGHKTGSAVIRVAA